MLIQTKQIDAVSLTAFVTNTISGGIFSGNLAAYIGASGYFGPYLLSTSGGQPQTIQGSVIFLSGVDVPYLPNDTGSAINQTYFNNGLNSGLAILLLQITGNTISLSGNDTIFGTKTFTGEVSLLQLPTSFNHAVSLGFLTGVSGVLAASAGAGNSVLLTTNQLITGIKSFVSIPGSSGIPINPTDLVVKSYVDAATSNIVGAVSTSGLNQNLSGTYNFTNALTIPIATQSTQPAQLAQLQALGTVMGGINGFGGVATINGTSGASGNIFLQSAGGVMVIQCGPIFYISGINGNNTSQLYSSKISLNSGVTGLQVVFSSGFQVNPIVNGNIEVSGLNPVGFIIDTLYNINTNGFNVAFNSAIPGNNYLYDFIAIPFSSGSGFFGLQGIAGAQGQGVNARGIWQIGLTYSAYDLVYQPSYNASFLCSNTNASSSLNAPGGTGNAFWTIYNSGAQGTSGIWNAYILYTGASGQIFNYGNTTTFAGSSYGYTGLTPTSGTPTGAGWNLIAAQGPIGYYINSGGIITGNFVNMSFFLNPVNTGLNLAESFVVKTFNITGFSLGCIQSGTGQAVGGYNGPLSGDFYTRDTGNNKNIIQNFTFQAGMVYSGVVGISLPVTGMMRIGIDLTNTLGSLQGLSIGIFGFGYL